MTDYSENMRRLDMTILSLLKEIDYKNHMLIEMEHKNKEESTSLSKVIVSLVEKIDSRERSVLEMTHKYSESSIMVRRLMNERAKIHEGYRRELRQLTTINTNIIHDMESLKEEHRQLTKELEESKALNDLQQKSFLEEIKREIVDENDEKLKGLRSEYGEMVYKVVANALMELENYNSSGRYAVSEIWNWKEGRSASLKEAIQYITDGPPIMNTYKRRGKKKEEPKAIAPMNHEEGVQGKEGQNSSDMAKGV